MSSSSDADGCDQEDSVNACHMVCCVLEQVGALSCTTSYVVSPSTEKTGCFQVMEAYTSMVRCEYQTIAVVKVNAQCTSGALQLIVKCGMCRGVSAAPYRKLEHVLDGRSDVCKWSKLNKRQCFCFFIVKVFD